MFLIDDLLLMPARGIMAVFREVHNAAQQDVANEAEAIRTELSELYMLLETQQLSEEDFDQRERELLDRLDEIEQRETQLREEAGDEAGEADGEDENEDEDEGEDEDDDDDEERAGEVEQEDVEEDVE